MLKTLLLLLIIFKQMAIPFFSRIGLLILVHNVTSSLKILTQAYIHFRFWRLMITPQKH